MQTLVSGNLFPHYLVLVSSYRLISLLSLLSKCLERVVHNGLFKYIEVNSLLSNYQFGFRPGSSTQDTLLYVTNDWQKQPDKRVSTAVALFFWICLRPSIVFHILAFLISSVTLRSQVPFINGSQNRRSYMYMYIHAHTCTWLLAIYL